MNDVKIRLIVHSISSDTINLSVKSKLDQSIIELECSIPNPITQLTLEKIRWYFEESAKNTVHVGSIENEIFDKGKLLFDEIFPKADQMRKYAGEKLENLELEIIEKGNTHFFPWELLIDSKTNLPLVVTSKKFLRSFSENGKQCITHRGIIRVLLIIARPLAMADVHLRTIALSLRKVIQNPEKFEFTILRPPTFKELTKVLESSKINKQPFHIVHFDGHGIHGSEVIGLDPSKGYLVFENEDGTSPAYIDGNTLGIRLKENDVDVLIMNACRSGFVNIKLSVMQTNPEVSLAVDLFDSGIRSVISMRYKVGVQTAMTFMQVFYTVLADGHTIEHSFHISRIKMLMENIDNDKSLKFEMLLPSLIQEKDVCFIAESKSLLKSFKSFFQSSRKEQDRKYFLYFDNLTIEIEKLVRDNVIVTAWGAVGAGKSMFIKDFQYWSLDTRLFEHVNLFGANNYTKPDFFKSLQSLQTLKNSCLILDDFDLLDLKLASEILNEFVQSKSRNLDLNNRLIIVTRGIIPEQLKEYPDIQIIISEQFLYDSFLKSSRNYLPIETISKDEYVYFFELTKGNILSALTFQKEINQASPLPSNFYTELNQITSEKPSLISVSQEPFKSFSNLDEKSQNLVSVLHIFHQAFSVELLAELICILSFDINAHILLSFLASKGFLIRSESDYNIWQLHPLLVGTCKSIFQKQFNKEEINEIDRIGEQWILAQYNNVFKRKIAVDNFFSFLSFKVTNKINCNYTTILKLYRKEIKLKDVQWSILLQRLSEHYEGIIKDKTILTEIDKVNILIFYCYYLELNIYRGDLKNVSNLFEKWPDFNNDFLEMAVNDQKNDILLIYSDLLYLLCEFEIDTSKVRLQVSSEELYYLPSLKKVKDLLFQRELFQKYASVTYILTEYRTSRTNNIISWYYLILQKKKMYGNDTPQPVPIINTYLNKLVQYRTSNLSGKKYEYLLGVGLLGFDKKKFIDYSLSLGFSEFVLGKIHTNEIADILRLYEEAEKYGDLILQERVHVARKTYYDTIRSKLSFCFLSYDNLETLLDSGVSASPSLILKFIKEQIELPLSQQELEIISFVDTFLDSFSFANKSKTDFYEESLQLILEGKFNQSITLLDKLNSDIETDENPFSAFIKRYDLISYLYAMAPFAAEVDFYDTPIRTYIRSCINYLIKEFYIFAYNHDEEFIKYPEMEKELEQAGYVFGSDTGQINNKKFLDIVKRYTPEVKNILLEELYEKILFLEHSLEKESNFIKSYFKIIKYNTPDFISLEEYSQYFQELDFVRGEIHSIRIKRKLVDSLLNHFDEFEAISLVGAMMILTSTKAKILNYVGFILRIENLLKQFHETGKPQIDKGEGGYDVIETLQNCYKAFISLIINVIVEAADTQYSFEERKIALNFFNILERYENYYRAFLPVPEIDTEFSNEGINSNIFKRTIKTVLITNQLTELLKGENNADSPYAWELIDELNDIIKTIPSIAPEAVETEDFLNAILYEYQVHWALFDMVNNRFNSMSFDDCDKRIKILEKEYLSEVSSLSKDLTENITSRRARQINRQKLAAAIIEAKEIHSSHREDINDFIEENQKPLQIKIVKQLYE